MGNVAYLPACVIYAIHMERVRRRNTYLKLVVISLVGLAISAGAFAAVIEAAAVVDVYVFAFETTLDISVIVVNNPKVARAHPQLAEAINMTAFFYGFSRFKFATGKATESLIIKALRQENAVFKHFGKRRVFLVVNRLGKNVNEYNEIIRYLEKRGIKTVYGINNIKSLYLHRIY